MQIPKQAVLLRIFIGEDDRSGGSPLYEAIVLKAREQHLAGAPQHLRERLRRNAAFFGERFDGTARLVTAGNERPLRVRELFQAARQGQL